MTRVFMPRLSQGGGCAPSRNFLSGFGIELPPDPLTLLPDLGREFRMQAGEDALERLDLESQPVGLGLSFEPLAAQPLALSLDLALEELNFGECHFLRGGHALE